jgi:preprotein translocase subunit SecB
MTEKNTAAKEEQQFAIQRIYIKDISYEAPSVPHVFQNEWKPELNLDINTKTSVIDKGIHEVVLTLTVTVKNDDKTAFLVEVHQAGIFTVLGFDEDQLKQTLGSFCPSVLYPYGREAVSDVVSRGGFPQLILAPINFDALYAQHNAEAEKKADQAGSAAS